MKSEIYKIEKMTICDAMPPEAVHPASRSQI